MLAIQNVTRRPVGVGLLGVVARAVIRYGENVLSHCFGLGFACARVLLRKAGELRQPQEHSRGGGHVLILADGTQ